MNRILVVEHEPGIALALERRPHEGGADGHLPQVPPGEIPLLALPVAIGAGEALSSAEEGEAQ